jgi:hypothetical protein
MTTVKEFCSIVSLAVAMLTTISGLGQSSMKKPMTFPLWKFDEGHGSCRAKGRLQDKEYCDSKLMDQIVTRGKRAIPILISQLTDTRVTTEPIFDFWAQTTTGDIAYFILNDLFTDSDWKTFNVPGLEARKWENCREDEDSQSCWRRFLKKHGRKFVQNQWLAAWNANKDRVYWDTQARCFRLTPITQAK